MRDQVALLMGISLFSSVDPKTLHDYALRNMSGLGDHRHQISTSAKHGYSTNQRTGMPLIWSLKLLSISSIRQSTAIICSGRLTIQVPKYYFIITVLHNRNTIFMSVVVSLSDLAVQG